jgi:hypothetical protein
MQDLAENFERSAKGLISVPLLLQDDLRDGGGARVQGATGTAVLRGAAGLLPLAALGAAGPGG